MEIPSRCRKDPQRFSPKYPNTQEGCGRAGHALVRFHLGHTHTIHHPISCSPTSALPLSTHHPAGPIHATPVPVFGGQTPQALQSTLPQVAGDARVSPLSHTLSAPNPDMRRQLGAGIPFPEAADGAQCRRGAVAGARARLCLLMCSQILPS